MMRLIGDAHIIICLFVLLRTDSPITFLIELYLVLNCFHLASQSVGCLWRAVF